MICLDTSYLIMGLVPGSLEAERLMGWSEDGEVFYVPAVVWYEFLCGPVEIAQVSIMRSILYQVLPFDELQADEAARLFNATGRRRNLRIDAIIASAATALQAPLAASNPGDFKIFTQHGLTLIR